jgi:ferritin-like metal-binding protein YciE
MEVEMQTAHELFLHEMSDMLDAERRLVEALDAQAEESSNPQVKKAFAKHQRQTERHERRLQQAFESLGEEPEDSECAGMKGLEEEHDNFIEQDPSEDILDIFNVGAAKKVECYEITAYESLIQLAQGMGHKKAVQLLRQNLLEEQQMLKKIEQFGKKLRPLHSGMGEESIRERFTPQGKRGTSRGRAA